MTQGDGDLSAAEVYRVARERYLRNAGTARRAYQVSETLLIVFAAAIPASVAFTDDARVPAVLGGLVVVLTGLRTLFRWHDNWIRNIETMVQLEAEWARFRHRLDDYDKADREALFVQAVKGIELSETQGWVGLRRTAQEAREISAAEQ
ncbi:DUF4231 domain-containing protein [Paractinoplanes atraurantiacus]|uniref:SMODS and SLOG-associating 2TM effector domain-containing protein n=1 Tax=Paractinoplanes atraurantiacus TaxID=1036182 RepID=A0A285HDR1_9ACTN|nr:DUF4231 domain-containing protein [Actinoplanes atraurantiacus]SNY33868.1 Protein of unknown function [Actinoplanes atraurantiacus]